MTADLVSGGYFPVLGIDPAVGRLLGPGDDVLSPPAPAAVISERYWQRRFGRSPSAIGKTFTVRGRTITIVGVTPPSYEGAMQGRVPDLMLPLLMMMSDTQRGAMDFNWLHPLARLKPGATVEQANAEVHVLFGACVQSQAARAAEKERPDILRQRAVALSAPDGFNPIRDNIAQPLLILMGIVGFILMLACVNLSGLLLARAAARQREISIRLAIGAGRGRLVRQFLTESLGYILNGYSRANRCIGGKRQDDSATAVRLSWSRACSRLGSHGGSAASPRRLSSVRGPLAACRRLRA